ncbi:MAG: ABC transporter permease [Bacteroidia bacterium]|nr:ABC transporter permease [Bacteroidia bacterium]
MAQAVSPFRGFWSIGYLGRRLLFGQGLRRQRLVFFLQLSAIALGSGSALLILILSYSFRSAITDKLYGYFGRFWIQYYANEQESHPRPIQRTYLQKLSVRAEPAIHLPVLVEGSSQRYEGVQLLAVDDTWWKNPIWKASLRDSLVGWTVAYGVVLSQRLAGRLGVTPGEKVTIVWLADPPRLRRLPVIGLYDAQIEEIDRQVAFVPLSLGQELLGWDTSQAQIGHLFMPSTPNPGELIERLTEDLPTPYELVPIENIFPDIFGWLGLIEQNVQVILGIVLGLSFFAVASGFLVLQFAQRLRYEVLWVLGATEAQLRSLSLFQAAWSVFLGVTIGLGWASLLLWTQARWKWFRLDPENYLLSTVPVRWHVESYLWVTAVGLFLSVVLSWMTYPRRRALRLLTQAE